MDNSKNSDLERLYDTKVYAKNESIHKLSKWASDLYKSGETRKASRVLRAVERMQEVVKK